MRDIAHEVATKTAIFPQVASGEATAIDGITIDRNGFYGAIFAVGLGNTSGAPTRFGITFKVQQKSGETDWVDVSGKSITFSGETVANQGRLSGEINVDLKSLARYIRCVATPTFTAGTTPKVEIAATVVLGEASVEPV